MGRYYDGDINGKFWFGVQDSNAADRFGSTGCEPNYIEYYFSEDDLEEVQAELKRIENTLGQNLPLLDVWFNSRGITNESLKNMTFNQYMGLPDGDELRFIVREYADYTLGKQIEQSIIEKGHCEFQAEL